MSHAVQRQNSTDLTRPNRPSATKEASAAGRVRCSERLGVAVCRPEASIAVAKRERRPGDCRFPALGQRKADCLRHESRCNNLAFGTGHLGFQPVSPTPLHAELGAAATVRGDDQVVIEAPAEPLSLHRDRTQAAAYDTLNQKPPNDKAQRTGPPRTDLSIPETTAAARVRRSTRLGVPDLAADAVKVLEVLSLKGLGGQ